MDTLKSKTYVFCCLVKKKYTFLVLRINYLSGKTKYVYQSHTVWSITVDRFVKKKLPFKFMIENLQEGSVLLTLVLHDLLNKKLRESVDIEEIAKSIKRGINGIVASKYEI